MAKEFNLEDNDYQGTPIITDEELAAFLQEKTPEETPRDRIEKAFMGTKLSKKD